jgi:hypothetical protein
MRLERPALAYALPTSVRPLKPGSPAGGELAPVWYLALVAFAAVCGRCAAKAWEKLDRDEAICWIAVPVVLSPNFYGLGGLLTCAVALAISWRVYENQSWYELAKLYKELRQAEREARERVAGSQSSSHDPPVASEHPLELSKPFDALRCEKESGRMACATLLLEEWDRATSGEVSGGAASEKPVQSVLSDGRILHFPDRKNRRNDSATPSNN